MSEHAIKIKEKYFKAVLSGEKTFEIRKNDRDYKVGDIIRFVPVDDECGMIIPHEPNTYKITYVFHGGEYGLEEGYCVFGIAKDDFFNFDSPVVRVDEKSYNKAIEDFVEAIRKAYASMQSVSEVERCTANTIAMGIAEKMKGKKS